MITLSSLIALLPLILQALIKFLEFLITPEGQKMLEQNRINWEVWVRYWDRLIGSIQWDVVKPPSVPGGGVK